MNPRAAQICLSQAEKRIYTWNFNGQRLEEVASRHSQWGTDLSYQLSTRCLEIGWLSEPDDFVEDPDYLSA